MDRYGWGTLHRYRWVTLDRYRWVSMGRYIHLYALKQIYIVFGFVPKFLGFDIF